MNPERMLLLLLMMVMTMMTQNAHHVCSLTSSMSTGLIIIHILIQISKIDNHAMHLHNLFIIKRKST